MCSWLVTTMPVEARLHTKPGPCRICGFDDLKFIEKFQLENEPGDEDAYMKSSEWKGAVNPALGLCHDCDKSEHSYIGDYSSTPLIVPRLPRLVVKTKSTLRQHNRCSPTKYSPCRRPIRKPTFPKSQPAPPSKIIKKFVKTQPSGMVGSNLCTFF